MASKIQIRRDTLANWSANNPVLSSGEIAFIIDENRFKVGNGSTAFSSLPYTTGISSITGTSNEVEVSASTGAVTISLPSTINANTTGSAASLTTARTISLGGDLSGSASFDGTSNITITASVDSQSSVNSISGTENEITVSASVGDITLSLPNTINANTTGTAASLTTARTIALGGDLSGSASFDGSASISITADIQPNSVVLGTDTTGNYVATASAGSGISISGSGSEDAAITISNTGVTSLTGTANQIAVSASNGDATLSFPSAVTFPGTVTLNANPQNALEAVTKQYVDAIAEGLHIHASVATATTASVDLSDAPTAIDGVNLTDGMRVLVKNQSTTAQNGIYTYSASADALVRASDFNSVAEIQGGDFVFVTGGNTYSDTGWVQTEIVTTLGTDPILFTQFSGAGTYTAGTGLFLDGTVFSNTGVLSLAGTSNEVEVSASSGNITIGLPSTITAGISLPTSETSSAASHYIVEVSSDGILRPKTLANVQSEIVTTAAVNAAAATTVGTITSGTWNGSIIDLARGGTNANLTAANGAIVYSTASALALTSVGTAGQVLTSNGAGAPTWQEAASGGFDAFLLAGL